MEKNYLTESSLEKFLITNFNGEWIHNKSFITKLRPDYRNESLKTIVEFDGYAHYTKADRILADVEKDSLYVSAGYKIIRIPYFIQLSSTTCLELFGKNINIKQAYPHGFIDDKCVLPADFCELGIEKFKNDLTRFKGEYNDIIKSIVKKIQNSKFGKYSVIPKSLLNIIE